jgi:hypothetical protein
MSVVSDLSSAVMDLFPTDQREGWKDEIAKWWGLEKLRYEHKQMIELFRKGCGVTKEKAIEMELYSREDNEKFVESYLEIMEEKFRRKLHKAKEVARLDVNVSFQYGAFATTEFPAGSGKVYRHDVPGHAGIVGRVYYTDGTHDTIFQRFISHPFWQYSHTVKEATNG